MKDEKPTILLVEDDADIMMALSTRLNSKGYHTIPAPDGYSALAVARQHDVAAAIVDIGLPGLDGLDVLRGLQGSGTRTLVITASKAPRHRAEAEALGCDAFIEKPFTGAFLVNRLEELLAETPC